MTDDPEARLQQTIDAQAERIVLLERELSARADALRIVTEDLVRMKSASFTPPSPTLVPAAHLNATERLRKLVILAVARLLPKPAKQFIKRFWDPWKHPRRVGAAKKEAKSPSGPRRLTIEATTKPDILCFSIIDWSFRWQRPQQLMSQFADMGHRVFVFKTTEFLPANHAARFEATRLRDNVWEITIAAPAMIDVYAGTIPPQTVAWFPSLLQDMRRDLGIFAAISLVQVATWREVAVEARRRFGWKLVYDCMDEWNSFPGMKKPLLEAETQLVAEADLVTVSAARLLKKWEGRNANVELVRNGADFAHFSAPQSGHPLHAAPRPVAGYFGAVAPWFDVALLAQVATLRPNITFVILGGIFDVDIGPLRLLPNVQFLGQQSYAMMPAYLDDFDACLIPFVVDDITAATDPVKFYEYISRGKPVVSTWMPELEPFRELLYFSTDAADFALQLDRAIAENDPELRELRIEAARANTWPLRATAMLGAIERAHPTVSIIIVSFNHAELTRQCLDSVLSNSLHTPLEVIVVDNASTDGSAAMLGAIHDSRVRVVLNRENSGFAGANNLGLQIATGSTLVLLNNDTVVPRGWLQQLLLQLEDPLVGLTVAVTNFSGNESRIEVPYTSLDDMHAFAEEHMLDHEGERFDIRVAAMYCVGMRRDVYESVGPLDETFGAGMFEDDDYSHRVRLAGYRVICAEDVFVHHIGQASFSRLSQGEYDALWARNLAHFETKWGIRWEPHRLRGGAG